MRRATQRELGLDQQQPRARKKRKPKLKRFAMSYAYDVPHYADFIIKASSEEEAERIARRALKAGRFSGVVGHPCIENARLDRVFCNGCAHKLDHYPDIEDVEGIAPAVVPSL